MLPEVARTYGAAEIRYGDFAQVCRDFGIRQEFTTRDRPEFNGVAERRIAMIEAAGLAAQIQARQLFSDFKIPRGDSLWSLRNLWACHALNCTATRANRGNKSPLETWYGVVPRGTLSFLYPGHVHGKRSNKLKPKGLRCYYIAPSSNCPKDSVRVRLDNGSIIDSRDVTWAHVTSLSPNRSMISLPDNGAGNGVGEGRGQESRGLGNDEGGNESIRRKSLRGSCPTDGRESDRGRSGELPGSQVSEETDSDSDRDQPRFESSLGRSPSETLGQGAEAPSARTSAAATGIGRAATKSASEGTQVQGGPSSDAY